ncbi:flagellar motor switch protein FliN/FliY [Granulicella rosea]|uniref:Flagellar motor switch protein FliN n=1 Tax=Granulicella rosea TaxID=474952 RepID=A0A239ELT6_9BACT|nr:FliM/FliN family flagellar motor switch protein [Granulicella rosea]SNS45228.1 flagellar motor switch protein FliN/FliY [Granulicella rosea]
MDQEGVNAATGESAASGGHTFGEQASNGSAAQEMGLLQDLELEATMQFGSRELPLRDVLQLGPNDLVELNRHVSEPVDLVVGNRIVARGEVVVIGGNFALRITEVAAPQLRLESVRCLS